MNTMQTIPGLLKSLAKGARHAAKLGIALSMTMTAATIAQAQQPAQGQPPPRLQVVPIDQSLLDRWLILFTDIAPQLSAAPDLAEDKVRAIFDRACRKAQLNDIGQCHAIDDYFGVLISGVSDDGTKFIDPVARARQDLAALNAAKQVPAKQKAEQKAEIEGFLSTLPERIPPEHIALLNRNAKRVFDTLQKVQGPAGGPPQAQPPPPGPAPKR